MRVLLIAASAAALAAPSLTVAEVQRDLRPAFGNTIVSTYPDGRHAELWLHADGSYDGEGRNHDRSSGGWVLKGDKLCLRQAHPFPVPFSYCTAFPAGGIGLAWNSKAITGEMIRIQVQRGRGS